MVAGTVSPGDVTPDTVIPAANLRRSSRAAPPTPQAAAPAVQTAADAAPPRSQLIAPTRNAAEPAAPTPAPPRGQPRIALLLTGIGLDQQISLRAIALPAAISLAVSPYAADPAALPPRCAPPVTNC